MTSRFDETTKQRIEELIQLGEEVKASFRMTPQRALVPDSARYEQWRTSSLNFLATALGRDSVHYNAFVGVDEDYSGSESKVLHFLGVLQAARDDIESGWVGRRELLLTADAFESFLEQADYLLEQGFKNPAAMLAGAVLESTLRKMCEVRGIEIGPRETIGTLNAKLAKQTDPPAYSSMYHKQIIAWADLRNNADHGHFGEYEPEHVRAMIDGVREFAARHLA